MRKMVIGCVLGASLALPAVSAAAPQDRGDVRNAARACRAELRELGPEAFGELYRNRGACVRTKARAAAAARRAALRACREQGLRGRDLRDCLREALQAARQEARAEARERMNAAQQCRSEREQMGEEAFRAQYGTNANGRNAFGKCVEQHASDAEDAPQENQSGNGNSEAGPPAGAGPGQDNPEGGEAGPGAV